jgi:4-alpha-glucanotransferase
MEVTFRVHFETQFGDAVKIVGNVPNLGQWKAQNAPSMKWEQGSNWSYSFMSTEPTLEYKYVLQKKTGGSITNFVNF